jgi:hypothetical protein
MKFISALMVNHFRAKSQKDKMDLMPSANKVNLKVTFKLENTLHKFSVAVNFATI